MERTYLVSGRPHSFLNRLYLLGLNAPTMCVSVAESPLQFYVNHASSPSVTAYGPGLSYGVANKTATFTVFTEDASEGTFADGG